MAARRRSDASAYIYEYIMVIHQHGYTVDFEQILVVDTPERPSHFVRILLLYKDKKLVHRSTGFSNQKLLQEAVELIKHNLLEVDTNE